MSADRVVLLIVVFATLCMMLVMGAGISVAGAQPCGIGWAYENEVCP